MKEAIAVAAIVIGLCTAQFAVGTQTFPQSYDNRDTLKNDTPGVLSLAREVQAKGTLSRIIFYTGPTWHIDTSGNDVTGDGSETAPFKTIQRGIEASTSGDTVLVADGHYYERISFGGKGIVLTSHLIVDQDTMHIRNTIIDGDTLVLGVADTGSVVRILDVADSTSQVIGLTIQHGIGSPSFTGSGGGILCYNTSRAIVRSCHIRWNTALYGGGLLGKSGLILDSCLVYENITTIDPNIYRSGGAVSIRAASAITNSQVSENIGGGISGGFGVNIENCTVTSNTSFGIRISTYALVSEDRTEEELVFDNLVRHCRIIGNEGNGIQVKDEAIRCTIENCEIAENTRSGLLIAPWDAGYNFALRNCLFRENQSDSGGAIYSSSLWLPEVSNCLFVSNSAICGGAIYKQGWSAGIIGCTFVNNSAEHGSAIHFAGVSQSPGRGPLELENCIFAFNMNSAALDSAGAVPTALNISCTDIYGNAGGDWVDFLVPLSGVNGNFSSDPHFCDTLAEDFHLYAHSECAPANNSCGVLIGARDVGCLCGDANGSDAVSISDVVFLINYIFAGGPEPNPLQAGDANCSGAISISDAVYLIGFIFAGGPAPCASCP